jgi:hypothetical protein
VFAFSESAPHFEREKRIEGQYVIAPSGQAQRRRDAVAMSKELTAVEQSFRPLKEVLARRPISHPTEHRVRAPIFAAAGALLVQRLLARGWEGAAIDLSAPRALQARATVRPLTFRLDGQPLRRGVCGGSPEHGRSSRQCNSSTSDPRRLPRGRRPSCSDEAKFQPLHRNGLRRATQPIHGGLA